MDVRKRQKKCLKSSRVSTGDGRNFSVSRRMLQKHSKHRECGHTPEKRPNSAPAGPCPFLLVGITNPYAEQERHSQRYGRCSDVFLSSYPKSLHQDAGTAGRKIYGSGVEKVAPRGIENTGFFAGVGEWQGVYICSPENWGNSFYIASLSGTLPDSPKSAHQPTHLGPVQRPVFKASKQRPHKG